MKKTLLLLVELNVAIVIFSQVTVKPVAKTLSPVTTQTPIAKSNTQLTKVVANATKMPAAWFRNDMDINKVISCGSWVSNGMETFLANDRERNYAENVNYALTSLLFYPDLSEGELVADYVTPMERGHDSHSTGFNIQKINLYDPANYKKVSWRIDPWMDGTFSLFSLRYKSYLALETNPSTGQVRGQLIDSARVTDQMKINFILYRTGRTVNTALAIYHPGTKTFLAVESNPSYAVYSTDEFSAQSQKLQKLPVKIIGTTAINMTWNMGDIFGTRNSLRYSAPGVSPDMDGDGHKAPDCNGDDCDDNDVNRFPGNPEKADRNGHDEDCVCNYELVDKDGDGFYDINSFNVCRDGSIQKGTDCDDNNAAIKPGALIYVSAAEANLCGTGRVMARTGMQFIRQQNGTAVEYPK